MDSVSCPKCKSPHGYKDNDLWTCPECFHEWTDVKDQEVEANVTVDLAFRDANGVELKDGDTVVTAKDLKVGKDSLKSGTKVKNIRLLTEPVDGHDISCKVEGFGSIYLKCSVVKKVKV